LPFAATSVALAALGPLTLRLSNHERRTKPRQSVHRSSFESLRVSGTTLVSLPSYQAPTSMTAIPLILLQV